MDSIPKNRVPNYKTKGKQKEIITTLRKTNMFKIQNKLNIKEKNDKTSTLKKPQIRKEKKAKYRLGENIHNTFWTKGICRYIHKLL